MQTRTRLTTPPGEEPAAPPSAGRTEGSTEGERYVPGLALPTEPSPPGRYRKLVIIALVTLVLIVAGYVALQIVTSGEDFDPAVGDQPNAPSQPAPAELPDGGEGAG